MRAIFVLALVLLAGCERPPMPQTDEGVESPTRMEQGEGRVNADGAKEKGADAPFVP